VFFAFYNKYVFHMKKIKRSKLTISNVSKEVYAIKKLYTDLLSEGFSSEQAFNLTNTIIKLLLK